VPEPRRPVGGSVPGSGCVTDNRRLRVSCPARLPACQSPAEPGPQARRRRRGPGRPPAGSGTVLTGRPGITQRLPCERYPGPHRSRPQTRERGLSGLGMSSEITHFWFLNTKSKNQDKKSGQSCTKFGPKEECRQRRAVVKMCQVTDARHREKAFRFS
jgi:hypothetical protein